MRNRDYKFFRADCYYHIYNRGNNKEPIFLDDQDYISFLKRCKMVLGLMPIPDMGKRGALRIRPLSPNDFAILAYCLMPNHFHLLIKQNTEVSIGMLINKVCTSYASYFNKKYSHIGNVFQDTFKAKIVENDSYLKYLSAYIHNNPPNPQNYVYSSYPEYRGVRNGNLCRTEKILGLFDSRKEYINFVVGFTESDTRKIADLLYED